MIDAVRLGARCPAVPRRYLTLFELTPRTPGSLQDDDDPLAGIPLLCQEEWSFVHGAASSGGTILIDTTLIWYLHASLTSSSTSTIERPRHTQTGGGDQEALLPAPNACPKASASDALEQMKLPYASTSIAVCIQFMHASATPHARTHAVPRPTRPTPTPPHTPTDLLNLYTLLLQAAAKSAPSATLALALARTLCNDLAVLVLLHSPSLPPLPGAKIKPNPRLVALLSAQVMPVFDGYGAPTPAGAAPNSTNDDDGGRGGGAPLGRGQRNKRPRPLDLDAAYARPAPSRGAAAAEEKDPEPSSSIPYKWLFSIRSGTPRRQCAPCLKKEKTNKGACPRGGCPTKRCTKYVRRARWWCAMIAKG